MEVQWLTAKEVSQLLRLSRKTVYYKGIRGEIPGLLKVGTTYRFNKQIIEDWLAKFIDKR